MYLMTACYQCDTTPPNIIIKDFTLNDDGVYIVECSKGHKLAIIMQAEVFEIFFFNATYNLLKKNYSAAILNYAAALEKYYEFYIEVICRFNHESKDDKWNAVRKKSGAQLELFENEYFNNEGRKPYLLTGELRNLRNRVIHHGHFPSYEEVKEYGKGVFIAIKEDLDFLNKKYKIILQEIIVEHNMQKAKKIPAGYSISTTLIDTGVSISTSQNWNNMTFEKVIDNAKLYLIIEDNAESIMAITNLIRGDISLEECKTLFLKILNQFIKK